MRKLPENQEIKKNYQRTVTQNMPICRLRGWASTKPANGHTLGMRLTIINIPKLDYLSALRTVRFFARNQILSANPHASDACGGGG